MKETIAIISGWAHDIEAIHPMADRLGDQYEAVPLTGARVLRERSIPDVDFIVTGSMGGLLAMELLPASCRKLVLISSTAKFCAGENYSCGTPERVVRRMIRQLKRNPETVLDDFFRNVHFPFRESRQTAALRSGSTPDVDELIAGLEYLLASDVRDKVSSITIPVLLLHGTEDRIIPAAASEWLQARLPKSELRLIENEGHALPAHHFETVMRSVEAFLGPAI